MHFSENLPAKRSTTKPTGFTLDDLDIDPIASAVISGAATSASTSPPAKGCHKSLEHEQLARHKSLFHNLTVYLDICVHNDGMINRGLSTLLSYRSRCKKSGGRLNIADVRLYNILLAGYAGTSNLGKIREILAIMRDDGISANSATYAAVFECVGRSFADDVPHSTRVLQEYEDDMKRAVR